MNGCLEIGGGGPHHGYRGCVRLQFSKEQTERVGPTTGSGAPTQNKTRAVAYILNLYMLVFLPDSVGKRSPHQAEGHPSREPSLLGGKETVCKVHIDRNCSQMVSII